MPIQRTRPIVTDRAALDEHYRAVRAQTVRLCDPLSPEDMVVQVQTCASPTKWHLAHSTWFFETFVLKEFEPGFRRYDDRFPRLFNSYYHGAGERHPRHLRGNLTRPGVGEVMAYRDVVDDRVRSLLRSCDDREFEGIAPLVELGLNHEQQHQELLLTDLKLLLHANPIRPAYREAEEIPRVRQAEGTKWIPFEGGVVEIGWDGEAFAYDNEGPRHRVFLEPYEIASRVVTNAEYIEFIEAGGYDEPTLWLDEGWAWRQSVEPRPIYWERDGSTWSEFTFEGMREIDPNAPACHLSFFEVDAYARWRNCRLPTEAEWEHAAGPDVREGNFLESGILHPVGAGEDEGGMSGMFGDLWEWTRSAHEPYPGYTTPEGTIGEYNGKFMCGSFVLRGGSCATSGSHIRSTYRNFFHPGARWQFAGVRLARSL